MTPEHAHDIRRAVGQRIHLSTHPMLGRNLYGVEEGMECLGLWVGLVLAGLGAAASHLVHTHTHDGGFAFVGPLTASFVLCSPRPHLSAEIA